MRRPSLVMCALGLMAVIVSGAETSLSDRFYRAIRDNDTTTLRELAADEDVDAADERGATPLMYAAMLGTAEQLTLLLDAGATVNARNTFDGTALIAAGGEPVRSRLLIDRGADVNARSAQGRTPLMLAAGRDDNVELVRYLLAKGADVRAEDAVRGTALHGAASYGAVETMRLLIERGADVNVATSTQGLTPLGLAVSSNDVEAVTLLLRHGADVNVPGMNDGVAVKNGRLALRDQMPLTLAAPYGSPAMLRTLLNAGAAVNARDERQMTPLMFAVASETQDVEVAKLLLKAGARVNEVSAAGETALDWASKFNNAPVLAVLQKAGAERARLAEARSAKADVARAKADNPLTASVALLQRSSAEFSAKGGCVGCHHQPVTAMAVRSARMAGSTVDEQVAQEQRRIMAAQSASTQARLLQGVGSGLVIDLGLAQGLRESDYPADRITDALVTRIAQVQQADGSWPRGNALSRAPMNEGLIGQTAQAVATLKAYVFPAARAAFDARLVRARGWLLEQKPRTTDDHAMLLFGLVDAGAPRARIQQIGEALLRLQRSDGGWAGNPNLASDAFATGETLAALRHGGIVTAESPAHRQGVAYLLKTQFPDGAWHVRSRAPKIQPYFQSGFPFDHDQWISAAATAWAATALAADRQRTVRAGYLFALRMRVAN